MRTAVVTGITGQDGSYLAELLVSKGYKVVGVIRRSSSSHTQTNRLEECGVLSKVTLVEGDLTDLTSMLHILETYRPDEIYNLAAQSHVRTSFDVPGNTIDTIVNGTLNVLEAAKSCCPSARIYLAGSSEMFGNEVDPDGFRRETTKMVPVSPYGCAKLCGFNLGQVYRTAYGMFVCSGILFNHESPRRGVKFVTAKVVTGAIDIKRGVKTELQLGNLDATRDWGHAKDYVYAMWLMLQKESPDDYVCATGKSYSVRDLCSYVFSKLDMKYQDYIVTDDKFIRPFELSDLKGDASKANNLLGWRPEYSFETLLDEMIDAYK